MIVVFLCTDLHVYCLYTFIVFTLYIYFIDNMCLLLDKLSFCLIIDILFFVFFFFFQAEDGIRDIGVTGVQTCALPIYTNDAVAAVPRLLDLGIPDYLVSATLAGVLAQRLVRKTCQRCRAPYEPPRRSEERRVGKECRSRWSPDH